MQVEDRMAADSQSAQAEVTPLFATPVLRCYWPDSQALNAELKAVILSRMRQSNSEVQSNRGGWRSKSNLETWPEECVKVMVGRIEYAVREAVRATVPGAGREHLDHWKIMAWCNVNARGAYNRPHYHDGYGNLWSGFYMSTPEERPDTRMWGAARNFRTAAEWPKRFCRTRTPTSAK